MKKTFIKMFYANNPLKNKIIPAILSFLLLLTTVSPLFASKAYAQNFPVLSGITYLNMPEKTFGGETTQCKLTITNFNLNKNKFSLSGILSYSNRNYPIDIEGTLYKSRIGKNNFVALAKDTTNTFDVLHFSILFNPNKHFLVTKKMRDFISKETTSDSATQKSLPLITLYLKRKNTREISFTEGSIIELPGKTQNLYSRGLTDISKLSPPEAETYDFMIFKPTSVKQKIVTGDSGADAASYWYETSFRNSNTGETSYYSVYTQSNENTIGNTAGVETRLTIVSKYTYVTDRYGRVITSWNDSPLVLGSYSNPVSLKAACTHDNAFLKGALSGNFNKRTSSLYLSFGVYINYLCASASLSYSVPLDRYNNDNDFFFPEPPKTDDNRDKENGWTRIFDISFNNTCLKYNNQLYDFVVYLHNIPPKDGSIDTQWNVPVYFYTYPAYFQYSGQFELTTSVRD